MPNGRQEAFPNLFPGMGSHPVAGGTAAQALLQGLRQADLSTPTRSACPTGLPSDEAS